MGKQRKKTRQDVTEIARSVVEQAIGEQLNGEPLEPAPSDERNQAAVALGRLGGKKGGPARASKLTKEKRSKIARQAAKARWSRRSTDSS